MASQVVVVGQGLAAVATAHALLGRGCSVLLIEEREPVAAGSSSEVESYRPWWPWDEVMTRLASRGTDLLDRLCLDSRGAFDMNRRGQLLVAAEPDIAGRLHIAAGRYAASGGGPLREHTSPDWYLPAPLDGVRGVPGGLDLLEGRGLLAAMPFLGAGARLGVMVRRAGWVDGRALRRWLLGVFRAGGGTSATDSLSGAERAGTEGWTISLASGLKLKTDGIVLAGARAASLALKLDVDLSLLIGTRFVGVLRGSAALLSDGAPMVTVLNALETDDGSSPDLRADGADLRIERLVPRAAAADGAALAGSILERIAAVVPALATHRGPPDRLEVSLTAATIGRDHRPLAGVVDRRGCYVVTGLEPDVSLTLGAADLVAGYFGRDRLPSVAPAVAPSRVSLAD